MILLLLWLMCGSATGSVIIYVDGDAGGANDGSSWCDAYNYLQDGLAAAVSGDEIRVAEGTYMADRSTSRPGGTGDRRETFQLVSGVMVRGGYAGCGQVDPDGRDREVYETVLSGDIGEAGVAADNSYHVVTGSGTDANTVLDGFTITGGNADAAPSLYRFGGGMYNESGSPTVSNCIFIGNSASLYQGGGMINGGPANPVIINCTFSGNSAGNGGGAMYNYYGSSPSLTSCIFWQNGPNQILEEGPGDNPSIAYSDIQGGWEGEGNIDSDPQFADADGPDDIVGTDDDNFRLLSHSPCVNSGDNNAVAPWVLTDLDGKARIVNETVDMGAYESEFMTVYYVDGVGGSDLNDGRTPKTAFATI